MVKVSEKGLEQENDEEQDANDWMCLA